MNWMDELLQKLAQLYPDVDRKQLDMVARLGSQSLLAAAQSMTYDAYWDSENPDRAKASTVKAIPLVGAVQDALALLEPMFPQLERNTLIYTALAAAHAMTKDGDGYRLGVYRAKSSTDPGCAEFIINGRKQYLHCLHHDLAFALFGTQVDYGVIESYVTDVWWHGIQAEKLPMFQDDDYGAPPTHPENPWSPGQGLINCEMRACVYLDRAEQVADLFIRHTAFVVDDAARQRITARMTDMFEAHPDKKWGVFITKVGPNPDAVRAVIKHYCWSNPSLGDVLPGARHYRPVAVSSAHYHMWPHDAEAFAAKLRDVGADVVISDAYELPKHQ